MRLTFPASALLLLLGCTACRADDPLVPRTIPLRQLPPSEALRLASTYVRGEGSSLEITEVPRALTVRAPSAELHEVERILQQYDRPQPDVTLHFQVIEADGFTTSDSAIADVENALRGLFRFGGYRLAAEALLRSSPQSDIAQQMIGRDGTGYSLTGRVREVTVGEDGRSAASMDLKLWIESSTVVLETSVNVPSGQTVVLGTSRPRADRPALILVVKPEVGS
jgi:type II secretory pathway component GspD/PulD (secretin)